MPICLPLATANTASFGTHRHSVIRSKFSSFGVGVLHVSPTPPCLLLCAIEAGDLLDSVKKEVETKLDFTTDIEFIMKSVKRKAG